MCNNCSVNTLSHLSSLDYGAESNFISNTVSQFSPFTYGKNIENVIRQEVLMYSLMPKEREEEYKDPILRKNRKYNEEDINKFLYYAKDMSLELYKKIFFKLMKNYYSCGCGFEYTCKPDSIKWVWEGE